MTEFAVNTIAMMDAELRQHLPMATVTVVRREKCHHGLEIQIMTGPFDGREGLREPRFDDGVTVYLTASAATRMARAMGAKIARMLFQNHPPATRLGSIYKEGGLCREPFRNSSFRLPVASLASAVYNAPQYAPSSARV